MKKFKLFADVIKEERWLNTLLAKGYECINISSLGVYTFARTEDSFVIRSDFQDYMSKEKYEEYIGTYEDFGWTHIKGSRWGSIHYWQKISDGNDDIFSDAASHIAYFKRLMNYSAMLGVLFLFYFFTIFEGNLFSSLFNIKSSYFTKNLWSLSGSEFWTAFIFETPFAILRFLSPWFFIITAFLFFYSYKQYEKKRKDYS